MVATNISLSMRTELFLLYTNLLWSGHGMIKTILSLESGAHRVSLFLRSFGHLGRPNDLWNLVSHLIQRRVSHSMGSMTRGLRAWRNIWLLAMLRIQSRFLSMSRDTSTHVSAHLKFSTEINPNHVTPASTQLKPVVLSRSFRSIWMALFHLCISQNGCLVPISLSEQ